jgi:pimeloyl-ACP methyl ester carboxylesterase
VTYDWPRLSLVTYAEDGTATYDHDREQLLAALAEAHSVLLLVHGIIGATDGMAAGVGVGTDSIADHFDAVLAFDYENLYTLIEDTGASLGAALDGLRAELDHDLEVTAVVHSMGGLVTRWALELEASRGRIQRLVTCGTPHRGSPWSRIEDFALSALGLGLNQLLPLGPPAAVVGQVLGFLTKAAEKLDRTLDQMRTDSELIQALADPEPSPAPYVVVRGSRPWPATTDDQRAKRIIAKLVTGGFDAVFKGEPNDMAVSVSSAAGVGKNWPQPPTVLDADCNHISYFSSEAGRAAVRQALGLPPP